MTLEEFIQRADHWHELADPDAQAAAFNAGYDNIHDGVFADNPHPEGTELREWFDAGERMALAHRDEGEDEDFDCFYNPSTGTCGAAGSEDCEFACPARGLM